jgi:predicted phosphodiesterase
MPVQLVNLEELAQAGTGKQHDGHVPASWQPSVAYRPDGTADVVTLGVGQPGPEDEWADEVRALGVTIPDGMTVRLVEVRTDPAAWVRHHVDDNATTEAVTRRRYVVEPARARGLDVSELVDAIGKRRPPARQPETGEPWAYIHAVSDWQIGKQAYGQGSDTTVSRILGSLDASVDRIKRERKTRQLGTIVLASLGDLCEGAASQSGGVLLASDLTVTEQLRVVRRLLLEHVKALAPLADKLVIPTAPGNHDEPHRVLNMKPRADDSFAVEASMQVADALQLAGGFDNVEVITPDIDDLTVTIEAAGTVITCAHGHQIRRGRAHEWWSKQGHARRRPGHAHLLLTGHFHHLRVEDEGGRTWIQCPTQDPGSPFFDQSHGGGSSTGAVTLWTKEGKWTGLEIL